MGRYFLFLTILICLVNFIGVSNVYADDHPNSAEGTTTLTTSVTGELEEAGDSDWFAFNAVEGQTYTFTVTLGSLDDSVLNLYSTDGTSLIVSNDDVGQMDYSSQILWNCNAGGIYYLAVEGYEDFIGTYTLTASEGDNTNTNGISGLQIRSDKTTLGLNEFFTIEVAVQPIQSTSSSLEEGDVTDAYLAISPPGENPEWAVYLVYDMWGNIYFSDVQAPIVASWPVDFFDFIPLVQIYVPDDESYLGSYAITAQLVEAGTENVKSLSRIFMNVSNSGSGGDDHGNDAESSSVLSVGNNSGILEVEGDVDWFSFEATEGQAYSFEVSLLSLGDSILTLYDSNGVVISENDDFAALGYGSLLTWRANATGVFYIRVSSYEDSLSGAYTLTYFLKGHDDYGNDINGANSITPGTYTGGLNYYADIDMFVINANSGQFYSIKTELGTLSDSALTIYNSDGEAVAFNDDIDDTTRASEVIWRCGETGIYYIGVSSYEPDSTGTYTLIVEETLSVLDDHGNDSSNATIYNNESIDGTIEYGGDVDWFTFEAQSGEEYTLLVNLVSLSDSVITLYDSDGSTVILENDDIDDMNYASQIDWTCDSSGRYYVEVKSFSDVYTGTYTLFIISGDDHGNTSSTATNLPEGSTDGYIEVGGDVDYFSFLATTGETYFISTILGTLGDSYLTLYSIDGSTMIDSNDDYVGYESLIEWECESSGIYYVAVQAFDVSLTGSYQILLSKRGADDHGDSASNATIVTSDSVTGELGYNDQDWFAFTAQAGNDYEISVDLGTMTDSILYLYGYDSNTNSVQMIIFNDDYTTGSLASKIYWNCRTSGTYYLKIESYDGNDIGTYTINILGGESNIPEHGNSYDDATVIIPGDSINGSIETGNDVDYFSFSATSGQTYVFETELRSLQDSILTLYNTNGSSIIEENDDVSDNQYNSRISFLCQTSGTYYIKVSAYDETLTGSYLLSMTAIAGDDHGNDYLVATEMNLGEIDAEIEYYGDTDMFAVSMIGGRSYTIRTSLLTLQDSILTLYGSNGTTVITTNDDYIGYESRIIYTPQVSAVFYISVTASSDDMRGTYILQVY